MGAMVMEEPDQTTVVAEGIIPGRPDLFSAALEAYVKERESQPPLQLQPPIIPDPIATEEVGNGSSDKCAPECCINRGDTEGLVCSCTGQA